MRTTSEFSRLFIVLTHQFINHGDSSGTCKSGFNPTELLSGVVLLLFCDTLLFPVLISAEDGLIMSTTSWSGVCTHTTILRQDSAAVCKFGSRHKTSKGEKLFYTYKRKLKNSVHNSAGTKLRFLLNKSSDTN